MNRESTSIPEQSIFYYIRQFFPNAQNRYKFRKNHQCCEIDIYIPLINVAIEYDGAFWHETKVDVDIHKNIVLNDAGLYIIRIRDLDCPQLPDFYGKIFYHGKSPKGMHTNEYIEMIIHDIAQFCHDKELKQRLINFKLTFEDYIKDMPNIMSTFYPVELAKNKSKFCGADLWDTQANGQLSLKNIPANDNSNLYVNFKCKAGKAIHTHISVLKDKKNCINPCNECIRHFCPLIERCNQNCQYIYDYILDYLNGKIDYTKQIDNLKIKLTPWLINLFKQRVYCNDKEWNKRFDELHLSLSLTDYNIIKSIGDFDFAKRYLEIYGNAIHFNLMFFDKTREDIEAVEDYFSAIYKKLENLKLNDTNFLFMGWSSNFISFTYNQLERNKSVISIELQNVVIKSIKKIEDKMIVNNNSAKHILS